MIAAVLVIDVQQGLCEGEGAAFDCAGTIDRINRVSRNARRCGVPVIFIQHESGAGYLEHGSREWQLAAGLVVRESDVRIRKTTPDAFLRTSLQALLARHRVERLVVCGMHSEFCVDSTVRAALAGGYPVTLVSDAHTSAGNAALTAAQVIAHHNETLTNISSFGPRVHAISSDAIEFVDQRLVSEDSPCAAAGDHPDEGSGRHLRGLYAGKGGVETVFDDKVADYVASRPDYPSAFLDALRRECRLGPDSTIADVAAGTGLLTRDLLRLGCQVVAVEPNDAMRAAADHLLGHCANYRSVNGRAERMPLADASIGLVTAAHAFHWFEVEAARAECLRVLTPEGMVALVWNDRLVSDPLQQALNPILDEFGGEKRRALVAAEDRGDVAAFFGAALPMPRHWPHAHLIDEAGLMSLVFSRSYMPDRRSARGLAAVAALRRLHARFASTEGLVMRYATVAWIGRPV